MPDAGNTLRRDAERPGDDAKQLAYSASGVPEAWRGKGLSSSQPTDTGTATGLAALSPENRGKNRESLGQGRAADKFEKLFSQLDPGGFGVFDFNQFLSFLNMWSGQQQDAGHQSDDKGALVP
jgi:hypothetical protein